MAGNFPIKPLVARQWPTTNYTDCCFKWCKYRLPYSAWWEDRSDVLSCDSYTEVLVVIAGLLVGRVKHVDLEAIPLYWPQRDVKNQNWV